MHHQHLVGLFLLGGTAFHTISLLSSSFVEEEHQTWYFLTVSICLLIGLEHLRRSTLKGSHTHPVSLPSLDSSTVISKTQKVFSSGDKAYRQISKRYRGLTEERRVCMEDRRNGHADDVTWRSVLTCVSSLAAVLVCCRIARTWNQTGDKWSHLPDVGDWLVR